MKNLLDTKTPFWTVAIFLMILTSCKNNQKKDDLAINSDVNLIENTSFKTKEYSQEFKDYWYTGKAEITSYKLERPNYTGIEKDQIVLIYVTEDFSSITQVKTNSKDLNAIPVLKVINTRKNNTGSYPYSSMQSTFYPIANNQHALKVSASMEEWCGQRYTQLNNRDKFEITSHSYYEDADKKHKLNKATLENELWAQIRIDPKSLPTGDLEIIPALNSRFESRIIKSYQANAELLEDTYILHYPELKRTLTINFSPQFPHHILGWTDFRGENRYIKAKKIQSVKTAYWQRNLSLSLRDTLQLN